MKPPSVRSADDPLDDPEFWRAIVDRLGLSPMPCPYSIKDLAAENGVDPERAFAKFWAHFHRRRVKLAMEGTRQWQPTKKIINLFWALL
jgi:hypothetical protein